MTASTQPDEDRAAFAEQLEPLYERLLMRAHLDWWRYSLQSAPVGPEDLVQETVLRLWRHWCANPGKRPTMLNVGYAYTTLRHVAVDQWRHWGQKPSSEELGRVTSLISENTVAEKLTIREAIAKLPERQRDVLWLHYYEGHSIPEVAEILRIRPTTAHNYKSAGLARLREMLNAQEGDE